MIIATMAAMTKQHNEAVVNYSRVYGDGDRPPNEGAIEGRTVDAVVVSAFPRSAVVAANDDDGGGTKQQRRRPSRTPMTRVDSGENDRSAVTAVFPLQESTRIIRNSKPRTTALRGSFSWPSPWPRTDSRNAAMILPSTILE
jgi:hypothetical protein